MTYPHRELNPELAKPALPELKIHESREALHTKSEDDSTPASPSGMDAGSAAEGQIGSIGEQLHTLYATLHKVEEGLKAIFEVDKVKFSSGTLGRLYGDVIESFRESSQRVKHPKFRIATIATTSAGKATLVNALIARHLAPMSADEMSAGILHLDHHTNGLTVHVHPTEKAAWPTGPWPKDGAVPPGDNEVYRFIRDEVMQVYHEKRNSEPVGLPFVTIETTLLPGVARDLLGLPAGIGFEIVDLPGLNSTDNDDTNLALVQEQLKRAFCVMVLDYTQTDAKRREMLLDKMVSTVRAMGSRSDAILFVLNKFDLRDDADSDKEVEKRIEGMRQGIKQRLGLHELPEVIPIDARSWAYIQCAWGPSSPDHRPVAPLSIRQECLKAYGKYCNNKIQWLSEANKEIGQ